MHAPRPLDGSMRVSLYECIDMSMIVQDAFYPVSHAWADIHPYNTVMPFQPGAEQCLRIGYAIDSLGRQFCSLEADTKQADRLCSISLFHKKHERRNAFLPPRHAKHWYVEDKAFAVS
jgi:hypothetical protein